jgi:uncharacterized membrane protein YdjX (TVP38/TMEM64 family)
LSGAPASAGIDGSTAWAVRSRVIGLVVVLSMVGAGLVIAGAVKADSLADGVSGLGAMQGPALAVGGALLVALMVPAGLVAAAAGYAVGTIAGTVVAVIATTVGAVLCAALSRVVGTPAARDVFGPRVQRTVAWLEARPGRTVVLARVVPGMPFNTMSVVLGFTRIPLLTIAAGTAIGFLPRCFAYAALGGSLHDLGSPEAKAALAASVVIAIVAIVLPRVLVHGGRPAEERA